MGQKERSTLMRKIEERRNTRVLCYLTSDRVNSAVSVSKDVIPLVFDHLVAIGDQPGIDILIYTAGGDTLAAFGLARLVREFTSNVSVFVPHRCHSAGTLFALGAKSIVMSKLATLSPIDPSVTTPLNPAIKNANQVKVLPMSVESVAGFRNMVKEHWQINGEEHVAKLLHLLAERVHPLALGDVYRATQQIELLARKLLAYVRDDAAGVDKIIQTLTKGLGSHDYLISRSEARELLGAQIADNDVELEGTILELYKDYASEMLLDTPYDPGQIAAGNKGKTRLTNKVAFIESRLGSHVFEREIEVSSIAVPGGGPGGLIPQIGIAEQMFRAGWTFRKDEAQ